MQEVGHRPAGPRLVHGALHHVSRGHPNELRVDLGIALLELRVPGPNEVRVVRRVHHDLAFLGRLRLQESLALVPRQPGELVQLLLDAQLGRPNRRPR